MFQYTFLVCLRNPACSPYMEGSDDWNHARRSPAADDYNWNTVRFDDVRSEMMSRRKFSA